MRKKIDDYYKELAAAIASYDVSRVNKFEAVTKSKTPKEVYLWLDAEFRGKAIPVEFEVIMKEFFFSIH